MEKRCRIVTEDEVSDIKIKFKSMAITWRQKSNFWNNVIIAGSKETLNKIHKSNYDNE